MAGGHQVAGLLVGAIANLSSKSRVRYCSKDIKIGPTTWAMVQIGPRQNEIATPGKGHYLGHSSLAREATADTAVDTLRLSPAGIDALEAIALVAIEALPVCS